MNQKGFANIIVIVLVVVLVGATGYFVLRQRPQNPPVNQPVESTSSDKTPAENIQSEPKPLVNSESIKSGGSEPVKKPADSGWKIYSKTNQWFGYSAEYPLNWSIKEFGTGEIGTSVYFLPPGETSEQKSISVVIINYKKTPPPPVWYTYTTLRKIKSGSTEILIQKREPGSEQYIATITKGDYTAEFRFAHGLDSKYDSVFDHIVSSFVWTK
ncbi:hypothetical protein HYW53_03605 [Candidatus Giovannonibacteria bacterium]|nr:hypothetical protein [Candidatus Giovannonibacteria bacterium]